MLPYMKIMRPHVCLSALIAVFIGGLTVSGLDVLYSFPIYLAMLSALLLAGGGASLNDFFDFESDKINNPKRPLPSGRMGKKSALAFSITLFILSIVIAGYINWLIFFIVIIDAIILTLYSYRLQNKTLLGNILMGFLVGSVFFLGGATESAIISNLIPPLLLGLLAGFLVISRETVKDLEDIEGDRTSFLKRLTMKTKQAVNKMKGEKLTEGEGYKKRLLIASEMFIILALITSLFPYMYGFMNDFYIFFIILSDAILLFSLFVLAKHSSETSGLRKKIRTFFFGKSVYRRVSKYLKISILLALIAFILGAVF
jgi:geranylgeranylglycerol-phosphate geranylgeranyltransferase